MTTNTNLVERILWTIRDFRNDQYINPDFAITAGDLREALTAQQQEPVGEVERLLINGDYYVLAADHQRAIAILKELRK